MFTFRNALPDQLQNRLELFRGTGDSALDQFQLRTDGGAHVLHGGKVRVNGTDCEVSLGVFAYKVIFPCNGIEQRGKVGRVTGPASEQSYRFGGNGTYSTGMQDADVILTNDSFRECFSILEQLFGRLFQDAEMMAIIVELRVRRSCDQALSAYKPRPKVAFELTFRHANFGPDHGRCPRVANRVTQYVPYSVAI